MIVKIVLLVLAAILFAFGGLGIAIGSLSLMFWGLFCLTFSFLPWRE